MSRPPLPAAPVAPPEAGADADWVVLAHGDAVPQAERAVSARRVIAGTAAAAAVIIVLVSVAGLLVSRRIAERQAVHDVAQLTDTLAQSVVQPVLTDAMATDPAAARRVLDPIVRTRLRSASLVRVKLWSPSGTVLYSDEPRLIGRTFALDADARAVFTDPRIEADVSDLRRPENRFERDQGTLLEVYRPVWTPDGEPLLFEAYFRYDTVEARSAQLWRGFAGIMLSSVAALVLLLIPLGRLVLARARRARDERARLAQHALDASDEERRRIASSLHDGVVQQLAAASFAAAGHAEQAAAAGAPGLAAGMESVAGTIRDGIAGLRSLLVDIYPPSLAGAGLAAALRDLARSMDATIAVQVDPQAAGALPPDTQQAVYLVAQEAVRNAVRHAHARGIRVGLDRTADGEVRLSVDDDGAGFTPAGPAGDAEGHFGMRLMADAARRCAGTLAVSSAPGRGTRLRLAVAAS